MLRRFRLPLIVALVLSPVTADLRHGLNWSTASADAPYCQPYKVIIYIPFLFVYPVYSGYNPPVHEGLGCYKYQCVRHGPCISEVTSFDNQFWDPKISPRGCLQTICIKTGAYMLPPFIQQH
jgi:hypothetical protein